jgi:hypothetical protein
MDYDHSMNAGNQADLVKHVALLNALTHLLDVQPTGRTFLYGDLHCGRPQYVLRDRGGWRDGVRLFAEHPAVVAARKKGDAGLLTPTPALRRFDALLGCQCLSAGATYLGSAGIAFRILRESNVTFKMVLSESNRFIADEAIRYFSPWPTLVSISCKDGYDFDATASFSLVLLDPVDLEIEPTLRAMERMKAQDISFLCWTPRRSAPRDSALGGIPDRRESEESLRFPHHAMRYGTCISIQWAAWGAMTAGCYLTASSAISEVTFTVLEELCAILDWSCARL